MKKKNYIAPAVEVVEIAEAQGIMAASDGEATGIIFDSSTEITTGSVGSKDRSDIWDLGDEE